MHNAPLASASDKEFHPPTLIMLEMHGGQIKRDGKRVINKQKNPSIYLGLEYKYPIIDLIIYLNYLTETSPQKLGRESFPKTQWIDNVTVLFHLK